MPTTIINGRDETRTMIRSRFGGCHGCFAKSHLCRGRNDLCERFLGRVQGSCSRADKQITKLYVPVNGRQLNDKRPRYVTRGIREV